MMGFDRVDRYISRVFWSSYLVAFLFFFGAFMVIDLFANMDEFVETARDLGIAGGAMLGKVAAYYLYSSPSVFLQVAPFVTVIGVIVCVARLLQTNELVPILMSGRSVYRMLRPVFLHAVLLTVAMILLQELVAPQVGERRIWLRELLRDGEEVVKLEAAIEDDRGQRWAGVAYNLKTRRIEKADVSLTDARTFQYSKGLRDLAYDTATSPPGWRTEVPFRWVTVEPEGKDEVPPSTEVRTFLPSSLDPRQLSALLKEAFDLSLTDLGYLSAMTGEARYTVLLHYHVTFPLTNILLLLLALPFMLRYERRTRYVGLAAAFLFCGLYFGADFLLRSLGESHLHPVLAAWFTPIFFGALGVSLFDGIRT